MIIIGIDPGYDRLGIAVVEKKKKEELLFSDCIETDRKRSIPERLLVIGKEVEKVFKKYEPDIVGIEDLIFNTNQKTATHVAEVRGIVSFLASRGGAEVKTYSPPQIKAAVTGYGHSSKRQVMDMVPKLITIPKKKRRDDEYDAIAVALCTSASTKSF